MMNPSLCLSVKKPEVVEEGEFSDLMLDEATCRNLDLVPPRGQPAAHSLLGVLDGSGGP